MGINNDIQIIIDELKKFSNERDWDQFHNPKDLAIAISIESSELLENFLWKDYDSVDPMIIKDELADVISYAFLLANKYNFNICDIVLEKIKVNELKYPVSKSKGNSKKYNELL